MTDTLGQAQMGSMRNPFNYDKFEQISRDLTTNWLTIDEIAQQLNLGTDESQDAYLESLELAVRMHIEDILVCQSSLLHIGFIMAYQLIFQRLFI